MANTFAPSEQAFDKVAAQGPAVKDTGAALAAQDAYNIGGCPKGAYMEKQPGACANALDIPPLWSHPAPESNSRSSSKPSPDDNVHDAKKVTDLIAPISNSNAIADEAFNPAKKLAPLPEPQSNSNAMRGSETVPSGADKSGWSQYEALDLDLKPMTKSHAVGDKKK